MEEIVQKGEAHHLKNENSTTVNHEYMIISHINSRSMAQTHHLISSFTHVTISNKYLIGEKGMFYILQRLYKGFDFDVVVTKDVQCIFKSLRVQTTWCFKLHFWFSIPCNTITSSVHH